MKCRIITETEAKEVIKNIVKGKFFAMQYRKKDGTLRHAICQLGVHSPTSLKHPTGAGESAAEALEKGRVKYFEPNHKNDDGTTSPAYRQAALSRIYTITTDGKTYVVEH